MDIVKAKDVAVLRVARGGDKVYKDECVYCFNSPVSKGGLYVSLSSFLGVCPNHLQLYYSKTQEPLYLHIVHVVKPVVESTPSDTPATEKPTRLAIGVEGGFDGGQEKVQIVETLSVVAMPELTSVPWPCDAFPAQVQDAVGGVVSAATASKQEAVAAWDGEKRTVSKHAEQLLQLDNGVKVPPSGWKCMHCDLTSNLWMNLTDGALLCGRKYFDGSGGNNHAVTHYESTRYPLAVKLGTITPEGADVYSYQEDEMVEDPHLSLHLKHFGIDITSMSKTDATMTELEIDLNMRIGEWSIIQESGKQLVPCHGPGCTGMQNLGNSCYLNSIMQVLFALPHFKQRYFDRAAATIQSAPPNPVNDFEAQMAKLAVGLLSGDYSSPPAPPSPGEEEKPQSAEQSGISPRMFKTLIGRGHPEFSSMRQQDAQEFFLHLLSTIDKNQRVATPTSSGIQNSSDYFRFQFEDRIECVASGKVRYSKRDDFLLQLPVSMETATNQAEVEAWEARKKELEANKQRINPDDIVRAKIPFALCLDKFSHPQKVEGFYSSALKTTTTAKKTTRFATFPPYLMVQMSKFSFGEDWVPKKYDVLIDVPDQLDVSHLKGCGLQQQEQELPDEQVAAAAPPAVELDEGVLLQLASMGFHMEGCKRALYHTQNQGVEPAMNWILEHMGDPDFSSPFVPPNSQPPTTSTASAPPEEAVAMVTALGFTRQQAIKALQATDHSVERAADWVFSHAAELDTDIMDTEPTTTTTSYLDGTGKYRLVAFVSHMGTSTMCGHYVCHILKDGHWVIYNDSKVALSEAPPRQLGYLYLFQRLDHT